MGWQERHEWQGTERESDYIDSNVIRITFIYDTSIIQIGLHTIMTHRYIKANRSKQNWKYNIHISVFKNLYCESKWDPAQEPLIDELQNYIDELQKSKMKKNLIQENMVTLTLHLQVRCLLIVEGCVYLQYLNFREWLTCALQCLFTLTFSF